MRTRFAGTVPSRSSWGSTRRSSARSTIYCRRRTHDGRFTRGPARAGGARGRGRSAAHAGSAPRPVHAGAPRAARRAAGVPRAAAGLDPRGDRRDRDRDLGGDPVTSIAVALFEGAEELDWAGPWEVLAAWSQGFPDDGVEVFTLAQCSDPVTCAKGLRVLPDHTWETAPAFDVLVYPGGRGTRRELADDVVLDWLRAARERGTLMTSVCTGSLVYAAAGLLH